MPQVLRLRAQDTEALHELLGQERRVNIFLKGFLDAISIERAWWYGVRLNKQLTSAILILPGRLAVPWAPDYEHSHILAQHVTRQHQPCMLVGPREPCDHLWSYWKSGANPINIYNQRLYECTQSTWKHPVPDFRLAEESDLEEISNNASLMELEDLGFDPLGDNPDIHRRSVLQRIKARRTFVILDNNEIVFQIVVGSQTPWGCQVGGTYVPKTHRRNGWATLGMHALCRHLLIDHPRVTLHVNEANLSAVRVYEKANFKPVAPYRLIVLDQHATR